MVGSTQSSPARITAPVAHMYWTFQLTMGKFLAQAMYLYQAAIEEELSFGKGDTLAVFHVQDDGWWEAQLMRGNVRVGKPGLVPSNYLKVL